MIAALISTSSDQDSESLRYSIVLNHVKSYLYSAGSLRLSHINFQWGC